MIPVKNIYYMLSYAYSALREGGFKKLSTEKFDHIADLYAAILCTGVEWQLKEGLTQEYVARQEKLSVVRGKVEFTQSLKDGSYLQLKLNCFYDEYTENCYLNRIVKSVLVLLLKQEVSQANMKRILKLLPYLKQIETLDVRRIKWQFTYTRRSERYRLLMGICELVVQGLLQSEQAGTKKLMTFTDERSMARLYEKFLLGYYQREHPELSAEASYIAWQSDKREQLPAMHSDVMLRGNGKVLIIDAKYYSKNMQKHYEQYSLVSANLYQIFTYVQNEKVAPRSAKLEVAGLLLYARTDSPVNVEDATYTICDGEIGVRTLDLNQEFDSIKKQLEAIVAPLS